MLNWRSKSRVLLAQRPTPLAYLQRTSKALGVECWIKRDDLTGVGLSGNKIRKLEFLLADAVEKECDTIITVGGAQSNHCRATAVAAAQLGLTCVVCLRTEDKTNPPPITGNIFLCSLANARIVWIDFADWENIAEVCEERAKEVRAAGGRPYIIPEGGSNSIGAWGYVDCAHELSEQLAPLPTVPTTIVYACGSGGTGAGLLIGGKMLDFSARQIRFAGFNVCDNAGYFQERIGRICRDVYRHEQNSEQLEPKDIHIVDGYVGDGYAKSRPQERQCIRNMAEREGIFLDPVYTGKAFYGLCQELAKDPARFGKRIVFLHTGGIFGLLAAPELFVEDEATRGA